MFFNDTCLFYKDDTVVGFLSFTSLLSLIPSSVW